MDAQTTSPFPSTNYVIKTTFAIFFLMLFFRMVILQGAEILQLKAPNLAVISICVFYGFISIIIWLNRNNLQILNIDKNLLVIFIIIGFLYSLMVPVAVSIFLIAVAVLNSWLLSSGRLQFKNIQQNIPQTIVLILVTLIPIFFRLMNSGISTTWLNERAIGEAIFGAYLPNVVFEEVIYRGLLWMFLVRANLKSYQIILIQAVLFWLSHLYYFSSDRASFWIWIPFAGIMLGIIVQRSKTITTSVIGHYLYNFLLALIH